MDYEIQLSALLLIARSKREEMYTQLDDELAFREEYDEFVSSKEKALRYCISSLNDIIRRALFLLNKVQSFGNDSITPGEPGRLWKKYRAIGVYSDETMAYVCGKEEKEKP